MKNESVAIVGIGTILPGSQNYAEFWNNSLKSKCFIREIPEDFWKIEDFYDTNPLAEDKTYSKMAGVVDPIEFNSMEFGIPPKGMQSISVEQLYGLVLARQALIDAGLYGENAKEYDKTRTGVIMAASVGKNVYQLTTRTNVPILRRFMKNCNIPEKLIDIVLKNYKDGIIKWDEASNPGYLSNVVSGRIANRFNFTGTTCSIDSACASGLTAVKFAAQELILGNCDVMIAGGITLDLSNVSFVSFCKTPALSKSDSIHPFDKRADGMLLGDGAAAVVLKRLSKAEEDGDRIYAVIEGIGSSSDGREKSIFSPTKKGQKLAISRALQSAGVEASQVSMIEAHGTATLVGDTCEVEALKEIFSEVDQNKRSVILGGSKGQTGHMRLASGIASLVRATLAIYQKQFLPTVGCEILNENVADSIFNVLRKPQPWIVNKNKPVRYASVSAFGFGGANYNILLKEYKTDHTGEYSLTNVPQGIIIDGLNKENLIENLKVFIKDLKEEPEKLYDNKYTYRKIKDSSMRIGFAVYTVKEAIEKVEYAIKMLKASNKEFWNIKGIMYASKSWKSKGKVTALFSGQGSQKCNMLSEITGEYPEMREAFTLVDNELIKSKLNPISDIVYPKVWFKEEEDKAKEMLIKTEYTQPSLAATEAGLYNVMKNRGFSADLMIGHSFGELVALYASGAYDEKSLAKLSRARGRYMAESAKLYEKTGMTAVKQGISYVKKLIDGFENVYIANQNSPEQIIIAGEESVLKQIEKKARLDNVKVKRLEVSAAFHSPFMKAAKIKFMQTLRKIDLSKPKVKVLANYNASEYKNEKDILEVLPNQIINPVLFQESIEKSYKEGNRIFVEIGPGSTLTSLVNNCLYDKDDYVAISAGAGDDSLMQLENTLISLAVLGLPICKNKYNKKLNPEIKLKKTKTSYTVPPTYFTLPDTKKEIEEAKVKTLSKEEVVNMFKEEFPEEETAVSKIVDQEVEEENNSIVNENYDLKNLNKKVIKEGENIKMNNYDAMYEIQKLNAKVVEEYVKSQNEQFDKIGKLLNDEVIKSDEDKKLLFDCVTNFQNNCLDAVKIYFAGQGQILESTDNNVENSNNEANEIEELKIEDKTIDVEDDDVTDTEEIQEVQKIQDIEEIEELSIEPDVEEKKSSKPKIKVDVEAIKDLVIETISEVTGYPDDMLETDMTLESDLGIDSIKRLELFSNINDKLGNIFGQEDMVKLAVVQTIDECIDSIVEVKEDPDHVAWSQTDIDTIKKNDDSLENLAFLDK